MGRISNDLACSFAGPGVEQVEESRQVAADDLLS